jgi:hypothetical protein
MVEIPKDEMGETNIDKPERAPAGSLHSRFFSAAARLVGTTTFLLGSTGGMIEAAAQHYGGKEVPLNPSHTATKAPDVANATDIEPPETAFVPVDLSFYPPRHFKSLEGQPVTPRSFDSAQEAFAAIQKGENGKPQGQCMSYHFWPGGKTDDWLQAVSDFLSAHPEIPYQDGSGGVAGTAKTYDESGYCLVAFLPLAGDGPKVVSALVYEAIGEFGPETRVVTFEGALDGPIYP